MTKRAYVVGISVSEAEPITHEGFAYKPYEIDGKRYLPTLVAWAEKRGQYVKKVKKIVFCTEKPKLGQMLEFRLI